MLINICKALVVIIYICNFHVFFLSSPNKNYTEIFHVAYERNLLSFQHKINFNCCMLMGEIDGLSLIFINLNVPTLIP